MLVVMVTITPDPYAVKPIPLGDMVELGFYGLALLGLILAWRWEILGGVIVLIGVLGNNNAFGFFRGYWFHSLSIPSLLFGLTVDGVTYAFAQTLAYYSSKLLPVLLLYSPD
ncbi:MAG: hypothetical protein IMZ62_07555 [Chloroflexi bacterium]|nr:hypothetical protein [Chloroflexota bacterium]